MASDGKGRHSPYTEALLRYLEEPGLEVGLLFRKVRDAVLDSTGRRQEPFVYGSLSSKGVYLTTDMPTPNPAATVDPETDQPSMPPDPDPEAKMWALIEDSASEADFEAYLSEYGGRGRFAPLARLKLQQIRRQSLPPPPTSPGPTIQSQPTPIEEMLAVCAVYLQANRLTTGAGGTALECYQEVLRQDAGNMKAIDGLAAIAERYRKWAEDAVQGSNWERAQEYLQKLEQVHPEHPAVAALETQLQKRQAEADRERLAEERRQQEEIRKQEQARQRAEQRRQEAELQAAEQRRQQEEIRKQEQARRQEPTPIEEMLAVCAAHLQANRLTTGAGGTALECYQEVLRQDAGNMKAIDGLAAIAERYRKWAEDAVQGSNWERAQEYLQKLEQVHPEHPAVAALETQLQKRQAEADRERLAEERRQQEEIRKQEQARQRAEQRRQEAELQAAEQRRQQEEIRKQEQARRQAEQRRQEAELQAAEQRRQQEEIHKQEQARQQAELQNRRFRDMLPMVHVKGGGFKMGCQAQQIDTTTINERPIRPVRLSSFEIGRYEVTQELWIAVMGENPSRFKGCSQCPVETVSWHEVQAFLGKLNALTGEQYRLPTEAEWEYAARGGQQSRRHIYAGGSNLGSVAWHVGNSEKQTHPVGQKKPNELRLFDMSGNVREWVQDWYQRRLSGSRKDPQGPQSGSLRVSRGGSWHYVGGFCRSTSRAGENPDSRSDRLGFRLARSIP